jgi:hypothetical protein
MRLCHEALRHDKAAGVACPEDRHNCTNDVCDGSGARTHPNKVNGTDCGHEKTCQNGECTGGLRCAFPCSGELGLRHIHRLLHVPVQQVGAVRGDLPALLGRPAMRTA